MAGFASRWHELKPKGGPSGNPAVVLTRIEEYAAAIQELREESGKLQKVGGGGAWGGGSLHFRLAKVILVYIRRALVKCVAFFPPVPP